ncbi:hypothetical protein BIW11_06282 [Tropilaelaps mercedesae]|uniref:Store-operated calcium entry-associated regulatory factor n=1 Tax=Tropilaelaps mercedesae TaxID=418985 RepID=A0A1V9XYP5_9ACAR|nr:hypothetical protein BIW11_06282 [Tropilaelaps mercedesae]
MRSSKGTTMSTAIGVVLVTLAGLSTADDSGNSITIINGTVTQGPILSALQQITGDDRKISIRKIEVLTFKAGRLAVRMRTTPPQQLNCMTGCFGKLPTSAQCKNDGWDGVSVSWRCQANVQHGRKLVDTRVRCEAFPEGDKEYILAGSCALDYSLEATASGGGNRGSNTNVIYPTSNTDSHRKSPLQYIIPLIMIAIIVVILFSVFKACSRTKESSGVVMGPPPGQPIGGGGFYGGPGAYPAQPGFNPGYAQPGYAAPVVAPHSNGGGGSALGAGVGGFAAGAATGGLLGYMLGNRGGEHHYSSSGSYGTYESGGGGGGNDEGFNGGGYEISTDFADTVME